MAYLKLVETLFKGKHWSYVEAPEQLVIILPFTLRGYLVCIAQSRATFHHRVISPVMGSFPDTDPNTLIDSARKEVKSETGHLVNDICYIMTVARSSGLTNECAYIYAAIVDDEATEQELHSDEDIQVLYFETLSDLQSKISNPAPHIVDSSLPYFMLHSVSKSVRMMLNRREALG
jgi:hypothetical protein